MLESFSSTEVRLQKTITASWSAVHNSVSILEQSLESPAIVILDTHPITAWLVAREPHDGKQCSFVFVSAFRTRENCVE